jgi:hypothetical protein
LANVGDNSTEWMRMAMPAWQWFPRDLPEDPDGRDNHLIPDGDASQRCNDALVPADELSAHPHFITPSLADLLLPLNRRADGGLRSHQRNGHVPEDGQTGGHGRRRSPDLIIP